MKDFVEPYDVGEVFGQVSGLFLASILALYEDEQDVADFMQGFDDAIDEKLEEAGYDVSSETEA